MTQTRNYAQPGSVSTATMRSEDLIPRFIQVLPLDDTRKRFVREWSDIREALDALETLTRLMDAETVRPVRESLDEQMSYLLNEDIWDAMNDIAPPGHYFGASEGDGADYGFWRSDEFDPDLYYTCVFGKDAPENVVLCGSCVQDTHMDPYDENIETIAAFGKCDQCGRIDEPCSTCSCTSHVDAVAHGKPDPFDQYGTEEHEALLRYEEHA